MPASLVPTHVSYELKVACNGLDTALWVADLVHTITIGASTQAPAVTVSVEPPRPKGTTPARQKSQVKRLLRRHNVPARVEFCPSTYPRLILTLDTADAVRRLTNMVASYLSGLDGVRYRLLLAARAVRVGWYFTLRSGAIRPGDLTVQETYTLYTALVPEAADAEFEPEDDDAADAMLTAFTKALRGIGVELTAVRTASSPPDVQFSGLSEESASRLADALARCAPQVEGRDT
ncbi:hypothetical protein ACFYMW_36530 [Streptomyces sp. NPDC006692]|uniref:hypothetical protein n=1 Tax=unclassified Streptomyces TaxID=2593676 RepID=UPI0036C4677E